ncbi:MAG: DUF1565 domain-containing protein [Lentisphaerae bacterium]|nr:DUF1565 domain-containing protein [Lentisphaerota bacterium]
MWATGILLASALAGTSLAQGVRYVDANAVVAGTPDGSSWANAYTNLAAALAGTGSGTNLWMARGIYRDASSVQMKSGVGLYGGFTNGMSALAERSWTAHATVLDGQGARTVILGANNAVLDGVVVTNGAAINGGGMYNNSVAPTVRNCVFVNNVAGTVGGAIYNNGDAADIVLSNCVFRNNTATYGGAIGNNDADPLLQSCQFAVNTASTYGGAVYNSQVAAQVMAFDSSFTSNRAAAGGALFNGSWTVLSNCVFRGNTATDTGGGGAAYLSGGTHTLRACDFIQNTAINGGALTTVDAVAGQWEGLRFIGNVASTGVGGAIYGVGNPVPVYAVRNAVFAGNQSATYGGAVYGRTSGTFENCVWSGNRTAGKGGGYSSVEDNSLAGSPILKRNRFAGNEAAGNGGAIWHTGGVVDLENGILAGNVAGGDGGAICKRADYGGGGSQIRHCTLTGNRAGARGGAFSANYESSSTITNSILWGNSAVTTNAEIYNPAPGTTLIVSHTDVAGGWSGVNNLNVDPQFVGGATGTWVSVGAYDAAAGQTALTAGETWAVNAHAGKTVNPDATQWLQFVIASNTVNTLYVWGNARTNRAGTAVADAGDGYRIDDVHIAAASPLVDRGAALGATNDLAGAVRPREGAPDVGAYEVQVDVLPPPDVTNLMAYPLHLRVEFEWSNPPSHDLTGVLVVRKDGAAPTGTPVVGQVYTNGQALGDGVVVHTAVATTWTDAPLTAGTTYHYQFFAFDDVANYSAGVGTSATPVNDTTAPAAVAGLSAAGGTGTVSLAWSNPPDTDFSGVVIVRRQGADPTGVPQSGVRYTAGQLLGDGEIIAVGPAADGTPGAANGYLDGNRADATDYHYALFAVDQVRNYSAGVFANASTAVDVVPPADVSGFLMSSGDTWVQLAWTNPPTPDLAGVLVLRRIGAAPTAIPSPTATYLVGDSIGDGVVVYNAAGMPGVPTGWRDEAVTNGLDYYYVVFARDEVPNYATGVPGSATPQVRDVLYVDWQAAGAANGTSWANAYTTVGAALAAAGSGSNIWVATGTYKPGFTRDASFVLKAGVGVYGGFTNGMTAFHQRNWDTYPTTLSGDLDDNGVADVNNAYHVVTATWATNAVLDGVTVTLGYAYSPLSDADPVRDGGGLLIWMSDVTPAIRNCRFINNVANYLGGAACIRHVNRGATGVVFSNCVFRGNATFRANDGHGGAIYHVYRPLTLIDSVLEDNAATITGGALESIGGDPILRGCTFARNTATNAANNGRGGAIYHDRSDLGSIMSSEITDCRFYANRASQFGALDYRRAFATNDLIRNCDFFANEATAGAGGVLFLYRYDSVIADCRFSGNTAAGGNVHAGALYLQESDPMLRNVVIAGNVAPGYGGGLWADTGSRPRFENALVAGNQARYAGGGLALYDATDGTNTLINCTIAGNRTTEANVGYGGGGLFLRNGIGLVSNTIFYGNQTAGTGTQVRVELAGDVVSYGYSDLQGGVGGTYAVAGATNIDAGNNLSVAPLFAADRTGTWTASAVFTNASGLTVLTDATAGWAPGKLAGLLLNPNTSAGLLAYVIATNTATSISVMGIATNAAAGVAYRIHDYRLQNVSPCVDGGLAAVAPAVDLAGVSRPQGAGVDLGAYERVREPVAPDPVTGVGAAGGLDQVTVSWTNPTNADFAGVLIVRRQGAAPTGVPAGTNEYSVGAAIGDGVVVYVGYGSAGGPGQVSSWVNLGVPAEKTFHYAVFAYDLVPNYAAGAGVSATTLRDPYAPGPVSGVGTFDSGPWLSLTWTNPPDADFAEVLIVRREGAAPTGVPVWTNRYAAGTNLGDGVVVYQGPGSNAAPGAASAWMDAGTQPSVSYYYRIFAADEVPNYAAGVVLQTSTRLSGVLFVDATANGQQNGRTWADAYSSLHTALAQATTNDAIWVAAGIYSPGPFQLRTNIAVYGGFTADMSTLAARNWHANVTELEGGGPVVRGANGARLDGFSLSGGNAVNGGGFYMSGGSMTVANCNIQGNRATSGGGLYLTGVQFTLERCRVVGNSATGGGGGLYAQSVSVAPAGVIRNCVFMRNRCEGSPDGKNDGGGIDLYVCPYRIENCTLVGNVTSRRGGGIKIYQGNNIENHVIKNCILWGNSLTDPPTGDFGGHELAIQQDSGSIPVIVTMSYTDWSPDASGERLYTFYRDNTPKHVFSNLMELDPAFANVAASDVHLKSGGGRWLTNAWTYDTTNSPCIDAGDPGSSFSLEPANNGGRINMGAYGNTVEASRTGDPPRQGGYLILVR